MQGFSKYRPKLQIKAVVPVLIIIIFLLLLFVFSIKKTMTFRNSNPSSGKRSFAELWENQDYPSIIKLTEKIRNHNPVDESALLFEAMSYFYLSTEQITSEEKEYCLNQSIILFRKLMALTDDPAVLRMAGYHLGKAYVLKGPYYADIAILLLQEAALEKDNNYNDIDSYLGEASFQLGDYKMALDYFTQASETDNGAGLQFRIAEVAAMAGEFSRAIEAYKTGIKTTNNQLERETALYKLGKLYYDMKRYQNAQESLEEYVLYNKANTEAYFMLGEIAWHKGDNQRARQYWVQCTRIEPGYRPALNRLYN
jgi:tetratricopeptide (TPR) repeat protein